MDESMNKVITAFLGWQFWAACLAIAAVVTTLSKALRQGAPSFYEKGWVKSIITLLNLGLGAAAAIPKDFLTGNTFGQRVFMGFVAGATSQFAYHAFLKRLKFFGGGTEDDAAPDKPAAPVETKPSK